MSRGLRTERPDLEVQTGVGDAARGGRATGERPDTSHDRDPGARRTYIPTDRLALPTSHDRRLVAHRGRTYRLRGFETDTLATVGAFRVVRADDLARVQTSRDVWTGDLRSLSEQGLIECRTVDINHDKVAVVVLTKEGKQLLEASRLPSPDHRPAQQFHAGLVKPREIAHDAQLFRLYRAEAARIEAEGGRVTRVVLDYELKRDYQRHLNRPDRPDDADRSAEVHAFATARDLPIVDDHLELPDLRIEFETADGRLDHRDLELVTEHYSRSQMAGKTQAGFTLYRAAGSAARGDGGRGSTPFDPHHLERLT